MFLKSCLLVMWLVSLINGKDVDVVERGTDSRSDDCGKCGDKLTNLQNEVNQQMKEIYYQQKKINTLEAVVNDLQLKVNNSEKLTQQPKPKEGGVTYVRWGRTTCGDSSTILYKG